MAEVYLDASIEFDLGSPGSVITGLAHLDGHNVRVKGDGDMLAGTFTVSGGQIDVSPASVTTGEVGLAVAWSLRTLELEAAPQTVGSLKSLVELRAHVLDALAVKVRAFVGSGAALEAGTLTEKQGDPPALVSGHVRAHLHGWAEAVQVELYDDDEAFSATILGLNTKVEF